jgi:hypothetical protein
MDLSKIIWRDGLTLLNSNTSLPFTLDADYEFDAPRWCDLAAAERAHGNEKDQREAADAWFAVPHAGHEPLESTPPAEPLIDPSSYSPYKSPGPPHPQHLHAPSTSTRSKVSPGPRRMMTGAAGAGTPARRVATGGRMEGSVSARKARKQASPIAIHSMLASTPMKGVASSLQFGTPSKLLSDSARRLAVRTPTSSSQSTIHAGPQRILVQRSMQFDTIDEGTVPMMISPERNTTAAATVAAGAKSGKLAAKRVSMVAPALPAAAPAAAANLFSSAGYGRTSMTEETAPAMPATSAAATKPRKSTARPTTAGAAKASATAASSTSTVNPRKRRSAHSSAVVSNSHILTALDAELESVLQKHNASVQLEERENEELQQMIEQHNRALKQQQQQQSQMIMDEHNRALKQQQQQSSGNIASPIGGKKTSPSAVVLGSGNKAPKKKMKTGLTGQAAQSTTTVRPKSAAASLNKSTSSGVLTARGSTRTSVAPAASISPSSTSSRPQTARARSTSRNMNTSTTASSMSGANTSRSQRSSINELNSSSASMTDITAATEESQQNDDEEISFHVEDLEDSSAAAAVAPSAPTSAPIVPATRKSMALGKALRKSVSEMQVEEDEDESMLPAATVIAVDDHLDDLIVLDPTPAPVVAPVRKAAAVVFTAAATTTAAGTSRSMGAKKPAGNVLANRTNTMTTAATTTVKKPTAAIKSSTTTTVKPTTTKRSTTSRPSTASSSVSKKPSTSAAATSTLLTSELVEDDEISALLASHNEQFAPKVRYVPRTHATKDIKAWEAKKGKRWNELTPQERMLANQQIAEMIA